MKTDVAVAKMMLDVGAVMLRPEEPFRYVTGIVSPIYIDNRVLTSHPKERKKIAQALEALVRANYKSIDAFAGTAMGGIPWSAWTAAQFNLPMVYVRDRAKRHGQKNQVEGVLAPGAATVIIEDLINTGSSALNSVAAVRRVGANPIAVVGIFSYGMKTSYEGFKEANLPLHTLTNLRTLVDTAVRTGVISLEAQSEVLEWAADPTGWGKKKDTSHV